MWITKMDCGNVLVLEEVFNADALLHFFIPIILSLHKVSRTSSQNISIAEIQIMQKNETFFGEREKYVFKPEVGNLKYVPIGEILMTSQTSVTNHVVSPIS